MIDWSSFLQSNMQGVKIIVVWYFLSQTIYQLLNIYTVKVIKCLALIQNVMPLNKIFTRGKWLHLSSNGELKIHNKHTSSLCETQLLKVFSGCNLLNLKPNEGWSWCTEITCVSSFHFNFHFSFSSHFGLLY